MHVCRRCSSQFPCPSRLGHHYDTHADCNEEYKKRDNEALLQCVQTVAPSFVTVDTHDLSKRILNGVSTNPPNIYELNTSRALQSRCKKKTVDEMCVLAGYELYEPFKIRCAICHTLRRFALTDTFNRKHAHSISIHQVNHAQIKACILKHCSSKSHIHILRVRASIESLQDEDDEPFHLDTEAQRTISLLAAKRLQAVSNLCIQPTKAETTHWYTPAHIINKIKKDVFKNKPFLDPASCAEANKVIRANVFYTVDDDGLTKDWEHNVYVNPPFHAIGGISFCEVWFLKAFQEVFEKKNSRVVIMLVLAPTNNVWFQNIMNNFPFGFFTKSPQFYAPEGHEQPVRGIPNAMALVCLTRSKTIALDFVEQFKKVLYIPGVSGWKCT